MSHTLYRIFDSADSLLYVGISNQGIRRINQHLGQKSWANEIARITFEECASRQDLEAREWQVITDEQPRYNLKRQRHRPYQSVSEPFQPFNGMVTLAQMASRLGLQTTGGLRVAIMRGQLNASRFGSILVVKTEEAERFIRDYTGKPGPKPIKDKSGT